MLKLAVHNVSLRLQKVNTSGSGELHTLQNHQVFMIYLQLLSGFVSFNGCSYDFPMVVLRHDNKLRKMYTWNLIEECHVQSSITQEGSFHKQIGLKHKE